MPIDPPAQARTARARSGRRADWIIAATAVAICAAIVAAISWTRPAVEAATVAYRQSGSLTYRAPASADSVYGTAGVTTGDPVYGAAVNALGVSYVYRLQAAAAVDAAGTEQLMATISDGSGLERTIPLQPAAVPFTGPAFTAAGTLRLADLQSIVGAFSKAAGAYAVQSYVVAIAPTANVHGHVGGQPFSTSFSPPISFTFTPAGNLLPAAPNGGTPSFTSSATGSVSVAAGKAALLLFGVSVPVARIGSLAVLLVALLAGGVAGWPLVRDVTSDDERARIAARHGSSVVEATAMTAVPNIVVVQLDSFEGLLQVARRLECPVLHWTEGGDVYAVVDSGTLYRYRPRGVPPAFNPTEVNRSLPQWVEDVAAGQARGRC